MTTDNPVPQPGDRVRVTRTRTEVFEGYWVEADDKSDTGHHAIVEPRTDTDTGCWRRVRDQGPVDFGLGHGGHLEADSFEVIEARDGAPYEHLLDQRTPPEVGPALSPALADARKSVSLATGAYVVSVVLAAMVVLTFFLDPLRAEYGRVGTAIILIVFLAALPAIPLIVFTWRTDRAVKQEMSQ
jgi:hypothetical protein